MMYIARKLCPYAGLMLALSAGLTTTAYADTSGLGITDDATVGFAWSPNSERDLAGYKLYVGTLPGVYAGYLDAGLATSAQLHELIRGTTYYFALTAYNTAGLESGFTPELTKQIPLRITNGTFVIDPGLTNGVSTTTNTVSEPPVPLAITSIPDQSLLKNRVTDVIPFTVSGSQSPEKLEVVAVSSNPLVLPLSGLMVAGSGGDYIIVIDPMNGRTGTSIVTVAATDGVSSTSVSFQVAIENVLIGGLGLPIP
jgi:hypothetical protein